MQDNLGVGGGGKYLLRGHWCANFCSTPVVIIILVKKMLHKSDENYVPLSRGKIKYLHTHTYIHWEHPLGTSQKNFPFSKVAW